MLDLNTVLELSNDIVLRGVGEKYWALNVSTGNQYKINEVSYFILNQFRTPRSIELMIEEVAKEYSVTRAQLEVDCMKVLQFAVNQTLVKEVRT